MKNREFIAPYSGTMINDLLVSTFRILAEHDTRVLVAEEMEVAGIIARSNYLPLTSAVASS